MRTAYTNHTPTNARFVHYNLQLIKYLIVFVCVKQLKTMAKLRLDFNSYLITHSNCPYYSVKAKCMKMKTK